MAELICPECGYKNEPNSQYCDDCGALLESLDVKSEKSEEPLSLRCGDIINSRYEVAQVVTRGNVVSTMLALDRENDDEMVWIKRKQEAPGDNGEFQKQKALFNHITNSEHENVVKLLDVFEQDNQCYTVFECLEGEDLHTLVQRRKGNIDEEQIRLIAIQAAEGLKHLHGLHILHRDIKPSHLFLTENGIVKLIGFGRICSMINPPSDNAVTEGFSPPEAFGLMGGKIGARSDIFSLGATLYYLVTNSEPNHFSREHAFNFIPLDDSERKIGKKFEEIIFKAVRKNPRDRFESSDSMLQSLIELDEEGDELEYEEEESFELVIASKSHIGKVRQVNQDSSIVLKNLVFEKSDPTEFTLAVVADGMGGVAEGDKASSLAVRVIGKEVLEGFLPVITGADTTRLFTAEDIHEKSAYILKKAIDRANRVVFDYSREDISRKGMGSTLTAVIIMKDNMCICHAGDTRGYKYNQEEGLVQLTEDHSLVGRLVRMGQLTWEEARTSPQRSAVYRALGTSPELEVDIYQQTIMPGDLYILCSDGVWEYFPKEELEQIISEEKTPDAIGETLLKTVLERGADDNATMINIYVKGKEEIVTEEQEIVQPLKAVAPKAEVPEEKEAEIPVEEPEEKPVIEEEVPVKEEPVPIPEAEKAPEPQVEQVKEEKPEEVEIKEEQPPAEPPAKKEKKPAVVKTEEKVEAPMEKKAPEKEPAPAKPVKKEEKKEEPAPAKAGKKTEPAKEKASVKAEEKPASPPADEAATKEVKRGARGKKSKKKGRKKK